MAVTKRGKKKLTLQCYMRYRNQSHGPSGVILYSYHSLVVIYLKFVQTKSLFRQFLTTIFVNSKESKPHINMTIICKCFISRSIQFENSNKRAELTAKIHITQKPEVNHTRYSKGEIFTQTSGLVAESQTISLSIFKHHQDSNMVTSILLRLSSLNNIQVPLNRMQVWRLWEVF